MHTLKAIAKHPAAHPIAWLLWALSTNINTIWYGRSLSWPWAYNHLSLIFIFYAIAIPGFYIFYKRKKLIFLFIVAGASLAAYIAASWYLDVYWARQLKAEFNYLFLDYAEARFGRVLPYALLAWYYAGKKAAMKRSDEVLKAEQSLKIVAMSESVKLKKEYETRIVTLENLLHKTLSK